MSMSRLQNKKKIVEMLEVGNIVVDHSIQQPLYEGRVLQITSMGYDPALAGEICVSRRITDEGICDVVVDGQHRLEAARRSGFPLIDAEVWFDLSYEDENWLFAYRNRKQSPHPVYMFRARLNDGEPGPVAINSIITNLGWRLATHKNTVGQFSAVTTAEQIYGGRGRYKSSSLADGALFEMTMNLLTQTWGHQPSASDQFVISAMALFLARYREQVDTKKLVQHLKRTTADSFRVELNAVKKTLAVSPAVAGAMVIHREYNKHVRTNKLAPFAL